MVTEETGKKETTREIMAFQNSSLTTESQQYRNPSHSQWQETKNDEQ